MQRRDLVARAQPQSGVEVGERLVEEEDARIADHRAAQRNALLLSPGQLPGTSRQQVIEPQDPGRPVHPLLDLGAVRSPHAKPETQVLRDGHVRI